VLGCTPGHIPRYMGQTSNNNNKIPVMTPVMLVMILVMTPVIPVMIPVMTPVLHVMIPVIPVMYSC